MREQLIQYVELLFAGAPDSEEIKQEILQNTLDRYDDLVAHGKSPEAAYRLAISGIGDVNEILGSAPQSAAVSHTTNPYIPDQNEADDAERKKLRAAAIAMYILCAIPLFILSEFGLYTLGLCLTLGLVATATYLIIISGKKEDDTEEHTEMGVNSPQQELKVRIGNLIRTITLVVFFIVSFVTGAWYITWLIFPIAACVRGLVNAIIDLKEVLTYEA